MKQYIPDGLALFRIFSAPVILYLLLLDGSSEGLMLIPAIIAFIAAWTDFFDGRLARKWNVTSKMGAFLDTIADKIFITFIFIGFTYIDRVSIWITTLLIAREFIITGLRGLAGNEGIMIPPSKFGKAKASLQFWAIGFVLSIGFLKSPCRPSWCATPHHSYFAALAVVVIIVLAVLPFACEGPLRRWNKSRRGRLE